MQEQFSLTKQENEDMSPSEETHMEHCEEGNTENGKKYYRCTYNDCGKVFRFRSEISRHLVIHFPKRPFQCTHKGCTKTFKRFDALENHAKIHTKIKPFTCEIAACNQSFSTKAGLKYHQLKHNSERPYKCTLTGCHKSFLTASQLKQHEKAYVCHAKMFGRQRSEEDEESPIDSEIDHPIQKNIHMDEQDHTPQPKIEEEEATTDQYVGPDFQAMLKYVLKENFLLEKSLEYCDKLITSYQEKNAVKVEYNIKCEDDSTKSDSTWEGPSAFFNQSENRFLDYLRGKTLLQ